MTVSISVPDVSDDSEQAETTVFDGRDEEVEQYWGDVDMHRFGLKFGRTNGVGVREDGRVIYKDAADESPFAAFMLEVYRQKQEHSAELREAREDGDRPDDHNLPEYRDQFDEPDYDHTVIDADNAEDYGIDPGEFEDDDPLFVPDDMLESLPTDSDGNLLVWQEESEDGVPTKQEVLESLQSAKGISEKRAGRALNALQRDGVLPSSL